MMLRKSLVVQFCFVVVSSALFFACSSGGDSNSSDGKMTSHLGGFGGDVASDPGVFPAVPTSEGVALPKMLNGASLSNGYHKQPSVAPFEPLDVSANLIAEIVPTFTVAPLAGKETTVTCISEVPKLEKKPGPYAQLSNADDFVGNVFFVSAGALDGDGTKEKPFATIGEAVAATAESNKTAAILVAGGTYNEDVSITAGYYLFGSFNPQTWERDLTGHISVIRDQQGSFTVGGEPSKLFLSIIDGFSIYGPTVAQSSRPAIYLSSGTQTLLRNNTIYAGNAPVTWKTYGDIGVGSALVGDNAAVDVYHNRFLVDSPTPEHIISSAIRLSEGCAIVANNQFVSYRTSLFTSNTTGIFSGNVVEDGYNGISIFAGDMLVQQNTIGLLAHDHGCGYAIYLGHYGDVADDEAATRPRIIRNTIILEGDGANGVSEPYRGGDPAALVDNRFVLQDPEMKASQSYMLYGDYDSPHDPSRHNKRINSIQEVNGLVDIPENSGNIVQ